MQKEIIVDDHAIPYTHRKSARARKMRLAVYQDGSIVLTTPARYGDGINE